ncbi:MAG: poly-beta-1,6-N-acetyl-D-glucosamine N-deacetylase PgaB [Gammaproteobacteria bacterium]|nr:poly-beta-1,6-N-acetyl-D-glucosamine N-deacetylase PgaB [Gammaproteobacteria bacterium]
MKLLQTVLIVLMLTMTNVSAADKNSFLVLCYHDVRDDVSSVDDQATVATRTEDLIAQFSWLKGNGYTVISLDDVLAAKHGVRQLPEKSVMLTFDDGYRGIYERVFPLLKLFNYPAVVGLVGKWLEPVDYVEYDNKRFPRDNFVQWKQVKEMSDSGLVEIASHSYNLHNGVVANPQLNSMPAMVSRIYDPKSQSYEDDDSYAKRVMDDLHRNSLLIEKHTGKIPRTVIWPYGEFNAVAHKTANRLGLKLGFTLGDSLATARKTTAMNRILVGHNMELNDFAWLVRHHVRKQPVRVAHVDLDYVIDANPAQQERNLSQLLDRIKALQINTVFLQAYADADGDGVADALYFPNRHLPVRADLFSRVAWQLRTRSGVNVYAWMPMLAFKIDHLPRVKALGQSAEGGYYRLSPFDTEVRKTIEEIYEDLGKHAYFSGLLFHDDGFLTDFEDASEAALQRYRQWGFPPSIEAIRTNSELSREWMKHKTATLIEWTKQLEDTVRHFRPHLRTARNIYSRVILEPEAEAWYAQSLTEFSKAYDYTAVMAMPRLEQAEDPQQWLQQLARTTKLINGGLDNIVFELQSRDWWKQEAISDEEIAAQIRLLQSEGIINYGYYPDNFIEQQPGIERIRPLMSIKRIPEF